MSAAAPSRPVLRTSPRPPAPKPPPWDEDAVKLLRKDRRLCLDNGIPVTGKYEPTPRPCNRVDDALTDVQWKIVETLRAIARGEYQRPRSPGQAPVVGWMLGEFDHQSQVSEQALAGLVAFRYGEPVMNLSTLQRNLKAAIDKHVVERQEIRRRGQKGPSNREASVFRLRPFDQVLAARKADLNIGTTHVTDEAPNGVHWLTGRSKSRRILSPEKVAERRIEQVVPAKKIFNAPSNSAKRAEAVVSSPPAAAPEARPSEAAVSSVQQPTKAAATKVVTADVRQALDVEVSWKWDAREQLRTQPMREWLGEVFGYACDDRIGCDIVSNAIATAARRDPPRDFPIKGPLQNFGHEGLIECCSWAIDKIRDPKTRVPRYKGSPAGYLAHMMADQAHVDGYLDNLERRRKREQKDASKAYEECQETLRQHKRKPTEDTYDLLAVRVLSVPEGDPMRKEAEALLEQGRPK